MNKCRHLIAVAGALLLLASATSRAQDTNVITRTARYWFTHVYSNDTTCATLERVVAANSNRLNLGFITLPTQLHTGGTEVSSLDATVEALGFYYRGISRTGDNYPGSKLCTARKQMVPELVAAIANNVLLGTDPANATYRIGANPTNFPPDLIQQATQAAAGYDVLQIRYWTLLLRKFNGSGVAKALATSPFECNQNSPRELRLAAYDPTLWYTCPSIKIGRAHV